MYSFLVDPSAVEGERGIIALGLVHTVHLKGLFILYL